MSWLSGTHDDIIGACAAVKCHFVFAAVRVGQIDVAVIIEKRNRNTMKPGLQIDAFHFASHLIVHFLYRFPVW